ncbi:hypothetical protein QNI16_35130 [Cytophagaceae bacterium YF14B1]|uniref:3-oxoacyl-ACP synthase n=1 Tax=Xanthocytophaga flava TaxID=3048013 RepID=A0AAE3R0A7_9BACT|nr:hypothetical protein [Xanthocytophaga flavus]MDJ1485768.1 hypothetical protein [Xanthocytophaga flavus]
MDLFVTKYCRLSSKGINTHKGGVNLPLNDMVYDPQALYTLLQLSYPKFFKMDTLCKYGILAGECLFERNPLSYTSSEIGIILSGQHGSLDTDEQFQQTLQPDNFFPSPALFVYTLSNIVMGELCIRYKIKGENLFTVSATPDYDLLCQYTTALFLQKRINACLVGWIDYYQRQPDILLVWVETTSDTNALPFNYNTLTSLYI